MGLPNHGHAIASKRSPCSDGSKIAHAPSPAAIGSSRFARHSQTEPASPPPRRTRGPDCLRSRTDPSPGPRSRAPSRRPDRSPPSPYGRRTTDSRGRPNAAGVGARPLPRARPAPRPPGGSIRPGGAGRVQSLGGRPGGSGERRPYSPLPRTLAARSRLRAMDGWTCRRPFQSGRRAVEAASRCGSSHT